MESPLSLAAEPPSRTPRPAHRPAFSARNQSGDFIAALQMMRTTPKPFEQSAIESGLAICSECQRWLDRAGENATGRSVAMSHHGALLLEAPTGAGSLVSMRAGAGR